VFNQLLKQLRKEKNVTQLQLAEAIGVSAGNVGDWESGKSRPGYRALASLSAFFGVSADTLLEIDAMPGERPTTQRERDLIFMLRALDDRDWNDIFDLTTSKYIRTNEKKF